MWKCASEEDLLKSGTQRNELPTLDKILSTFSEDFSQAPSAIRNTVGHLKCRQTEVSQWQTHISETISQMNLEIAAVEQMKDLAERFLHERQAYSQHVSSCVAISSSLSSSSLLLRRDPVLSDLRKEEQLTMESQELLQNHICILLDKLSSLQEIHMQLQADVQDKDEAIKLITKCITDGPKTPTPQLFAAQCKLPHISHDDWLFHCKTLRLRADDLVKESSSFRRNVRFCLIHQKNAQEQLRRSTQDTLRKKVHELTRVQETLKWEKEGIQREISDLTKNLQEVTSQIRNCDSRLQHPTHCLDILSQRPRYEHCLDPPYISLALERQDLSKMAGGFSLVLKRIQKDLELAEARLLIQENKLAKATQTLELHQRCQHMHQSFQPTLDYDLVLAYKLQAAPALEPTH